MDNELNATFFALDGYVEVLKYSYLYFSLIFAVYLFIILSNSTIVYLIWARQNLHEPMYVFIAALSLNSLLYSTNVYPKLLVDSLSERQTVSVQACIVQYFTYYASGSADFTLLAAMALDRYVSICKPLSYPNIMRKRTIVLLLFWSWFLPFSLSACPAILVAKEKFCNFTLKGILCNNALLKLQCVRSKIMLVYGLFGLTNLVVLPMLFILFTYAKILAISYRSSGDTRRKAAETCLPHLLVLICFFLLCAYDVVSARLDFDLPKTVRLVMSLQVVLYSPLLNPLIYGIKMKEISKHLKKLLCQVL
ncbi:unnamed protein product [Ophioblennius macclurei]